MKTANILLLSMLVPLALASHTPTGRCSNDGALSVGIIEFGNGDPSMTFYLVDESHLGVDMVALYQETNGIYTAGGDAAHNLQRDGGASAYLPDDPAVCVPDPAVLPDWRIAPP